MRILTDENIPSASVHRLRQAGHDVLAIAEEHPGLSDRGVLELAVSENRIVLTFDRDFGRMVFLREGALPPGVILLRFIPSEAEEPGDLLASLILRGEPTFEDRFTVIDRERVRQRPLTRAKGI
jgi:predicted nuclease of predicted toxin-antitoxin system